MPRRWLLLALLATIVLAASCGGEQPDPPDAAGLAHDEQDQAGNAPAPAAPEGVAPEPDRRNAEAGDEDAAGDTTAGGPGDEDAQDGDVSGSEDELIALRRYERLVNGQRAAVSEVRWFDTMFDGRPALRDVTVVRERSARMMGGMADVFENETRVELLRTHEGELISQVVVTDQGGSRRDRTVIRRVDEGYRVDTWVGRNHESFVIGTATPVQVEAETLLGPKIRAGEAEPGTMWTLRVLDLGRRKVVEHELEVLERAPDGSLKVVESFEGHRSLWWFGADGSVLRQQAGVALFRRDDTLSLDDLPVHPASWSITLPANVDLPRIFTTRTMIVDVEVDTDETVRPPRIPDNPFTEVIEEREGSVRLELRSFDDPAATGTLPLAATDGLGTWLEATPLMEVDDPAIRRRARDVVGDEKDARRAVTRIADFVFRHLRKASPDIGQPTAKWIDTNRTGDCSEHALYFTALCRAAGIPARRCSGYVCIGSDWGAHAWCEVWVGDRWIGADPTTNEVGTRARYIFLGRPGDREGRSARIVPERTRILIRRATYADGTIDFDAGGTPDAVVWSGLRLVDPLPEGWSARRSGSRLMLTGPEWFALAWIEPDHHGFRTFGPGTATQYGGTFVDLGPHGGMVHRGGNHVFAFVPLGRENLRLQLRATREKSELPLAALAEILAPTLGGS